MIVRMNKDNCENVIANFDYFNDYEDTHKWCLSHLPEAVSKLELGFKGWRQKRNGS